MRAILVVTGTLVLSIATPALAHRVDEYLQATTISIEKDRVLARIRLTPGIEVLPEVLAVIDTDRDDVISIEEQRTYSERLLRDLSLSVDGERLALRLASFEFPGMDEMKDGRGVIQIDFDAVVPPGGQARRLEFANHHFTRIADYLVNSLVPRDADISISAQHRNYEQSSYRLDYVQAGSRSGPPSIDWWSRVRNGLGLAALLPFAWLVSRRGRRIRVANRMSSSASAALED